MRASFTVDTFFLVFIATFAFGFYTISTTNTITNSIACDRNYWLSKCI